jgi:23S rRNA A2030 N6-methylase RlmJ
VGTGLCIVNPPHVLAEEARILLPWLANRMALEAEGKDARFMVKG